MAINYNIEAAVVDITTDTPKAGDAFMVDTNVWYWITYSRASQSARPPASYQTSHYPNYTNTALGAGAEFSSRTEPRGTTHLIEKADTNFCTGKSCNFRIRTSSIKISGMTVVMNAGDGVGD